MDSSDIEATIQHLTGEVRRTLRDVEHEPVGVLTAYKLSILRLADAIDRLADEVDSQTKPRRDLRVAVIRPSRVN